MLRKLAARKVKIVDLNVLLYAVNRDAAHHERVRRWWSGNPWRARNRSLAWVVVLGFLRLATNPHVFLHPMTPDEALERVAVWLAHANTQLVAETDDHWRVLRELLRETGTAGNLTTDAHLAAIAIAHNATIVSCDADFSRFPRLRWENPAAG